MDNIFFSKNKQLYNNTQNQQAIIKQRFVRIQPMKKN